MDFIRWESLSCFVKVDKIWGWKWIMWINKHTLGKPDGQIKGKSFRVRAIFWKETSVPFCGEFQIVRWLIRCRRFYVGSLFEAFQRYRAIETQHQAEGHNNGGQQEQVAHRLAEGQADCLTFRVENPSGGRDAPRDAIAR